MANMGETFKVLIVGTVEAGKTAFLRRYCDSTFSGAYTSTVGIDFRSKEVTRDGETYTLQLWDTAGQERYQSIVKAYFQGSKGFIIMFDLTAEDALEDVKKSMAQIKEANLDSPKVILVGNKSDLTERRVITKEQGMELANSLGIEYLETSVKDDINVAEVVDKLFDLVYGKPEPEVEPAVETEKPIENPVKKEPMSEKKPVEKKPNVETIPQNPTKPLSKPAPAEAKSSCSTGTFLFIGVACVVVFCAWYFS